MSHTATVEVEIKIRKAFETACKKLGLDYSLDETVTLYDGTTVRGMRVNFPGWRYPAVFANGKAHYDVYGGRWGNESELKKFRQRYAAEAAKIQARKQGFRVAERVLTDGRIQLTCSK